MKRLIFLLFFLTNSGRCANLSSLIEALEPNKLCSVYDPFKVLPENNKFQIGGSFPLHHTDCTTLRPETVQEIVAIQWALTHWNQNEQNHAAKLGLYAGDTCSRSAESLSQSLRFLDSVGYHEPKECRTETPGAKLLGLIAPKDYESSISLGKFLSVSSIPVAAYSSDSVNALTELEVEYTIATSPTIGVYVDALIRLMNQMHSNLITIVDDGSQSPIVKRVIEQLSSADIFVSETIPIDHPFLSQALEDSDSTIIVSILNKTQMKSTISKQSIYTMHKIWISIPTEGEVLDEEEQETILNKESKLVLISLQPKYKELPQFRDYFVRVLKNNYKNYQLLTSYIEQVHNCTNEDCNLDKEAMLTNYVQARTTEPVIRMTYAFAAVAKKLVENKQEKVCAHASVECTDLIMNTFLELDYEFTKNDPLEFYGEKLKFYQSSGTENILLASGMIVEAIEVYNDDKKAVKTKLLSFTTGSPPTVIMSSLRSEDQKLRSICAPYRPFCGQCPNVQSVNSDRHFLSIPRHYPLYLVGLFDLHNGQNCQSMSQTDISLPMAFVHTVWTFKQRFPQLGLLKDLDFGALLIDSCSSGKQAIESIVRSETQCFRFNQAGRNITIVPKSVFGYASALRGDSQESLKGYFSSGDTDASLVSVESEHSALQHSFTALPSSRSQALALLKLLNRMQWQFVTAAISEQDPESLSLFRSFERLALDRGVCLAEVVNINGGLTSATTSSSTNVTIVFATARDAAKYLKVFKIKKDHVHIMMGDSHDWYLYAPDQREQFPGTVSVQPKNILYADFEEWLETTTPLTLPELWYWSYIEDRYGCALSQKSKVIYGRMCSGDELLNIGSLGRMTKAGYLSRGVERFLFAMDSVYKNLCPAQNGICLEFYEQGRKQILNQLKKTSTEDDVEIYEYLPDVNGHFTYHRIANWSLTTGLRMSTQYRSASGQSIESKCHPPMCKCFLDGDFFQRPLESFVFEPEAQTDSDDGYIKRQPTYGSEKVEYQSIFEHISSGNWRHHPHNYVLLAFITVLVIIAFAVLILVLAKLYLRVVKGNQSLGISLLIGIIILYITAYFFVFDPTDTVCRFRVILHGLGYSICFGVIIAKATQLRNAETLGFGTSVHISFWNYWQLLFFIVGVQIALSNRWFMEPFMSTIGVVDQSYQRMMCTLGKVEFVVSNSYVMILIFMALFLNLLNRNIKRNYKETKWLLWSTLGCFSTWVAWIVLYLTIGHEFRDTVIVVELIACATILLGFLFGPKIYILLSYEPVVVALKREQFKNTDLFEKDDDIPSIRAVSPASSTSSSSNRSSSSYGSTSTTSKRPVNAVGPLPTPPQSTDEQSPIFHTVMRKKTKVKRSNSEHDTIMNVGYPMSSVPIIRSPSSRKDDEKEKIHQQHHHQPHPHQLQYSPPIRQ